MGYLGGLAVWANSSQWHVRGGRVLNELYQDFSFQNLFGVSEKNVIIFCSLVHPFLASPVYFHLLNSFRKINVIAFLVQRRWSLVCKWVGELLWIISITPTGPVSYQPNCPLIGSSKILPRLLLWCGARWGFPDQFIVTASMFLKTKVKFKFTLRVNALIPAKPP